MEQRHWIVQELPDGTLVDRGFATIKRGIPNLGTIDVDNGTKMPYAWEDRPRGGVRFSWDDGTAQSVTFDKHDFDEEGMVKMPLVMHDDGTLICKWWWGEGLINLLRERGILKPF